MAGKKIAPADWERLKKEHDHRCAYCGKAVPLTMDHRIPLIRGGPHVIENILPACKPCNSSKHAKSEEEFRSKGMAAK